MATLTYAIKLGATDISGYIKREGYSLSYEELWTEANRNMAGNLKATFLGWVPKIELVFRELTQSEMSTLLGLLNTRPISVTYWNEQTDAYTTANFYRGPLKTTLIDIGGKKYKEMSVNLIGFNKV